MEITHSAPDAPATRRAVRPLQMEYWGRLWTLTAWCELRRDFRNSLYAAFTPDEVRQQLGFAGLQGLQVGYVSDRHLAVSGRLG